MTIPTTNLKLSDIQTAFGGTNPISLSEYYRGGSLVPIGTMTSPVDGVPISTSGTIRMGMFRGVSATTTVNLTVSSNTANYNIFTAAGSPAGVANVTVTINSGNYVYGTGANPAITTGTGWAAGSTISLINNGFIVGFGGSGGLEQDAIGPGQTGQAGGVGLTAAFAITVTNNNIIAGGGGGGGSGGSFGGAFGGHGGAGGNGAGGLSSSPGSGTSGATGGTGSGSVGPGPGRSQGTAGNAGQSTVSTPNVANTSASNSINSGGGGGGGGGWGSPGGFGQGTQNLGAVTVNPGAIGSKGGSYATGTSFITWAATGTRYGTFDNGSLSLLTGTATNTYTVNGTAAFIALSWTSSGLITANAAAGTTTLAGMYTWFQPCNSTAGSTPGSSYWLRATLQSGSTPSVGTLNTWQALSASVTYQYTTLTTASSRTGVLLIELSTSASGTPIVSSGTYSFSATHT